MVVFDEKLTKNKMDLNNRKMNNHPPSLYYCRDCAQILYKSVFFYFCFSFCFSYSFSNYEQETSKKDALLKAYHFHSFQLRVNFLSPVCMGHYF